MQPNYALKYIVARNPQGVMHHLWWLSGKGSLAITASGKRPPQATNSVCFTDDVELMAYCETWRAGKTIIRGPLMVVESDNLDVVVVEMKMRFSWVDADEHWRRFKNSAKRSEQLPATYGWW